MNKQLLYNAHLIINLSGKLNSRFFGKRILKTCEEFFFKSISEKNKFEYNLLEKRSQVVLE